MLVCVHACIPLGGGAFVLTGLSDFTHVISVWTAQDTICLATTDAKRSFAPGSKPRAGLLHKFPRIRVGFFFFSVFTFWISFSLLHTLHSFDDDGCAPSQFTHLGGLVQGPSCSRAHLGHTAAELHVWAPCPYF